MLSLLDFISPFSYQDLCFFVCCWLIGFCLHRMKKLSCRQTKWKARGGWGWGWCWCRCHFLLLVSEGARMKPEMLPCLPQGYHFLHSSLSECETAGKSREVHVSFHYSACPGIWFMGEYFFLVGVRNNQNNSDGEIRESFECLSCER